MTEWLRRNVWRACFLLSSAALFAGGPLHPDGTMAEMLAHPDWLLAHVLMTLSFGLMAAGLWLLGRAPGNGPRMRKWLRLAFLATVVQTIDMVLHTTAMVDHGRLVAGLATPVLTSHLAMSVVVYPLFAVVIIGFLIAAGRDRVLGGWWIAWLGMIGVAAQGVAAPLAVIWDIQSGLFGFVTLLAFWMILAACWPARSQRPAVNAGLAQN